MSVATHRGAVQKQYKSNGLFDILLQWNRGHLPKSSLEMIDLTQSIDDTTIDDELNNLPITMISSSFTQDDFTVEMAMFERVWIYDKPEQYIRWIGLNYLYANIIQLFTPGSTESFSSTSIATNKEAMYDFAIDSIMDEFNNGYLLSRDDVEPKYTEYLYYAYTNSEDYYNKFKYVKTITSVDNIPDDFVYIREWYPYRLIVPVNNPNNYPYMSYLKGYDIDPDNAIKSSFKRLHQYIWNTPNSAKTDLFIYMARNATVNVEVKVTKTYTNSTWSTNKTWYIQTKYSKNSSRNVVNYEPMLREYTYSSKSLYNSQYRWVLISLTL